MEFFLLDPITGPYVLTCPAKLAEALAAGHTMLPHEDAYMGALAAHAEKAREQLAAKLDAQREAARLQTLTKEEIQVEADTWIKEQRNPFFKTEPEVFSEPDYSSPEYVGTPDFDEPKPAAKVWTRPEIDGLLRKGPKAVERAMIVLFDRQTADEQSAEYTKHSNGRGFAGYAARSGTYYAKWVLKGRQLSGTHLAKARKIALKHSRQLVEEANAKGA